MKWSRPCALICILSGCGEYDTKLPYSISLHGLSAERAIQVRTASALWNEAVGFEVFHPTAGNAHKDIKVKFGGCEPGHGRAASASWNDKDIGDCSICSSANLNPLFVIQTIMHELGHCTGLGHDDHDDDSVMAPSAWFPNVRQHHIDHIWSLLEEETNGH